LSVERNVDSSDSNLPYFLHSIECSENPENSSRLEAQMWTSTTAPSTRMVVTDLKRLLFKTRSRSKKIATSLVFA
jgi:hypothetical protein